MVASGHTGGASLKPPCAVRWLSNSRVTFPHGRCWNVQTDAVKKLSKGLHKPLEQSSRSSGTSRWILADLRSLVRRASLIFWSVCADVVLNVYFSRKKTDAVWKYFPTQSAPICDFLWRKLCNPEGTENLSLYLRRRWMGIMYNYPPVLVCAHAVRVLFSPGHYSSLYFYYSLVGRYRWLQSSQLVCRHHSGPPIHDSRMLVWAKLLTCPHMCMCVRMSRVYVWLIHRWRWKGH